MAKRRVVDVALLGGLVEGAINQEIVKGVPKTTDPNFPVFKTPLNERIIVYIPKTMVTVNEDGETMQPLETHVHDYKKGKMFGQIRCINNLNSEVYSTLGYDGSCPACDAMSEVWELYNAKLAKEAAKVGVDPQNDLTNQLEGARAKIVKEMDLSNADEYVTFPIVIIPIADRFTPTADAIDNLQPVFVTWKKKRYNETIISALDQLVDTPEHPAGLFWSWNYTYDTEGKPANARDSAKNAKFGVLENEKALVHLTPLVSACESAAREFTATKAAEVLVVNQFMYREDMVEEVDMIMKKTRQMLDVISLGGDSAMQIGVENTTPSLLAGFKGESIDASTDLGLVGGPVKFAQ